MSAPRRATIPRVLAIAGSDSGGGAGIQADIKTITMLGGHAMTAITAVTAQNTTGVTGVWPLPTEAVMAQIAAVADDIGVDAVKIGMIGSAETAQAVAGWLETLGDVPIVLDPVMVATSGAVLADGPTVAAFARLMDVATVTTPNLAELAALAGLAVADPAGMARAARAMVARHGRAVLAKGGHLPGDRIVDLLATADATIGREDERIETRHSHGTGCTLASGIAAGLAAGMSLEDAWDVARGYVRAALLAAPGLGAGAGPMGHGLGRRWFA